MTVTIKAHEDHITVQGPQKGIPFLAFRDACQSIDFGWWSGPERAWYYPLTQATEIAERFFGREVHTNHDFDTLVGDIIPAPVDPAIEDPTLLTPIPITRTEPLPSGDDATPWRHQAIGFNLLVRNHAYMLGFYMGRGKTRTLIDLIINLGLKRTLIVAPHTVAGNVWPGEFEQWAVRPITIIPLDSDPIKKRIEKLEREVRLADARDEQIAFIINYEAVCQGAGKYDNIRRKWIPDMGMAEALLGIKWDLLACDESQKIKAHNSKVSKFLWRLSRQGEKQNQRPRRVCLTGTALEDSPLDAHGQYRFMDHTVFGPGITQFRAMYTVREMVASSKTGKKFPAQHGYRNLADLHRKFYSLCYRVPKDVEGLPPAIHQTQYVELSTKARAHYRRLERNLVTQLESGLVTAANRMTLLIPLQRITSGHLQVDPEEVRGEEVFERVDTAKADALAELLEGLPANEPVVVFCRFNRDIDVIAEVAAKSGRACIEHSQRCHDLKKWQQATGGEVLALGITAGGVGVNLTRAWYCVYYSVDYSRGKFDQSQARLHRHGQTHPVTFVHLLARDTVDERIYRALQAKRDVINAVLEGLGSKKEKKDVA